MNDADHRAEQWLEGLRDGPDRPLPDRLRDLPPAPRRAPGPAWAAAALVLVGIGVALLRLGPPAGPPHDTTTPNITDTRGGVPESPLRRLTRIQPARLAGHATTVRHERGARRVSSQRSVLGDLR